MIDWQILQRQNKLSIWFYIGFEKAKWFLLSYVQEDIMPSLRTLEDDCINAIFYDRFRG